MIYGCWEIERDKHNFLSFWTIFFLFTFFFYLFVPFYLLPFSKDPKNQNFEKTKKASGDIIILHKCTKKHDHMLHCSRDTEHDRCNFRFSFWAIFCPFTPLKTQKIKILKKWTKHLETSSFYTCAPKIMITRYTVPEIWCATDEWTDWQTDGWTDRKSDILRWVPHLKRHRNKWLLSKTKSKQNQRNGTCWQ